MPVEPHQNVMTYLAKGDVALSISMTMASTLIGVFATPFLCAFYLSETVSVDTPGMLLSIMQMVFLPVFAGVIVNHLLQTQVVKFERFLPSLSILLILCIIAIVVALNSERLVDIGLLTLVAVILHNSLGLASGFFCKQAFRI